MTFFSPKAAGSWLLLLLASSAAGAAHRRANRMVPPALDLGANGVADSTLQKRTIVPGTFEQLIDHANPSLGTFSQRYWYSDEYYAGPGSPVVFFTPGEIAADGYLGYLTNYTITGIFAQAVGGAVVMMEHRYWGESSPFDNLTTENMQYLTLDNAILDTTYFAENVVFPFDANRTSRPAAAPWVMSGGSYSGALSGWTHAKAPGTFWAFHASSAVVEAVDNFWQYFAPVQEGMPANCSADVSRVVDYVDGILLNGSAAEKQALKAQFNLSGIEHDDDFVVALENGPWLWQDNQFYTGYSGFFQFCDYVENMWPGSGQAEPGAAGVGLEKALAGYAKWASEIMLPGYCESYDYWTGEYNLDCFNSYNATSPIFTDLTIYNEADRQWEWFLCNQPFEFWQDGAPANTPSIVSRLVTPEYWTRQCALYFPPETVDGQTYTYGLAQGQTVADVNAWTEGWFPGETTRLVWTNGQYDPWRDATVSSDFRPGGPLASSPAAPVNMIPAGIHCSDLLAQNGQANAGVQAVIDAETATIKAWVDDFYTEKKIRR